MTRQFKPWFACMRFQDCQHWCNAACHPLRPAALLNHSPALLCALTLAVISTSWLMGMKDGAISLASEAGPLPEAPAVSRRAHQGASIFKWANPHGRLAHAYTTFSTRGSRRSGGPEITMHTYDALMYVGTHACCILQQMLNENLASCVQVLMHAARSLTGCRQGTVELDGRGGFASPCTAVCTGSGGLAAA